MLLESVTYLKALFNRNISVFAIIAILATFADGAQKKQCPLPQPNNVFTLTSIESKALRKHIRQMLTELEYPEAVTKDFITMIDNWENPQGQDALTIWKIAIAGERESYRKGSVSGAKLAYTEKRIVEALAQHIRKEITFKKDYFDLPDIIEDRYANCFGYSQLFYILGNSIDLSVSVMNMTSDHIANIVSLSDGTVMIVDLIKTNDFVSECIVKDNQYDENKNRWRYKDGNNYFRENKTICLLDKKELTSEIYFCRGTLHFMAGRNAEAIFNYNRAIELNPQNLRAYNNRGGAHFVLREYSKAVSDFDMAINLSPTYIDAYYNRANAYLALGQYGKSITDYTKAIELNPEYARAYYTRALCYAGLTEYTKARQDMLQAVKLDQTLKEDVEKAAAKFELDLRFD